MAPFLWTVQTRIVPRNLLSLFARIHSDNLAACIAPLSQSLTESQHSRVFELSATTSSIVQVARRMLALPNPGLPMAELKRHPYRQVERLLAGCPAPPSRESSPGLDVTCPAVLPHLMLIIFIASDLDLPKGDVTILHVTIFNLIVDHPLQCGRSALARLLSEEVLASSSISETQPDRS